MFRKIWQRVTRSDDPVSLTASTAGENLRKPSIDFPNAEHLPFYWFDRSTGASHLIATPEELVNLHIYHGDIYYQNRDFFEALSHFDEAIRVIFGASYTGQKYAAAALAYGKRANVYFNAGNYDKAIEDYGRAIKLEPDISAASPLYVGRGKAYIRKDDPDKAIQDLDTAILIGAGSAEAHFDRGHAYTNKGEFGKAVEDFSKANELDSDSVAAYIAGRYGGGQDDRDGTFSPYDIIRIVRQDNIGRGVSEAFVASKKQKGFPKLVLSPVLAQSALSAAFNWAGTEVRREYFEADYDRRIRAQGYIGGASVLYYRQSYPMNTTDEKIITSMSDVLCEHADNIFYEDFGMGIVCAYPNVGTEFSSYEDVDVEVDYSFLGVFIVIGLGCTDGSAYAVARINEVREAAGAAPLEIHDSLVVLARKYISMDEEPDAGQLKRDMRESGYAGNALQGPSVRHGYSGAYESIPEGVNVPNYENMGKLAASGLIRDHHDSLLRSDWQHIGIAVRLVMNPTYGRSVQAEVITAWQLPEGSERPAHFPTPPDATTTDAL